MINASLGDRPYCFEQWPIFEPGVLPVESGAVTTKSREPNVQSLKVTLGEALGGTPVQSQFKLVIIAFVGTKQSLKITRSSQACS